MENREKLDYYCTHCGRKMLTCGIRADRVIVPLPPDGALSAPLDTAFSKMIGTENFADMWECPLYKERWFRKSDHDMFVVYKKKLYQTPKIT